MKRITLIPGFWERVDIACKRSGMTKADIARQMGRQRNALYRCHCDSMNASTLMRFCRTTNTSADWLLGLKEEK